jgi:uncharacterized protein
MTLASTPASTLVAPTLYWGEVLHRRLRPRVNAFRYRVCFVALPMSRLGLAENRWFSINRFNLFSLHYRDYGPGDGRHPLAWLRELLAAERLGAADGEIVLQTFPRVLGYVFNPVSFWHCFDRAGDVRAVVCEVNNTFGERHCYLLAHPDGAPLRSGETLHARKVFHVSPFFPVAGDYRFRFRLGADRALARIDYHDAAGDLLHTSVSGSSRDWTARSFARTFAAHGWMTLAVIARIHYQALRLAAKRVRFFRKPAPPAQAVTRERETEGRA